MPKRNYFCLASITLFAASITQQCYCTTSSCADSIMALLLGGLGMFTSAAAISWLANPLLLVAWIISGKKQRTAMFFSMFAFLFALSFLLFDEVVVNEAGHSQTIIQYKAGYWLWVASCFCMMAGNFAEVYKENVKRQKAVKN